MRFLLNYEKNYSSPVDPDLRFARYYLPAEGEVFYMETELIVFHESFQTGSRPLYAASLSNLHYVERPETRRWGPPGFEVRGEFPSGKEFELWAEEAQTFYSEQGFAVFYDRPDRSGKQILAVRCSDVKDIQWLPCNELKEPAGEF